MQYEKYDSALLGILQNEGGMPRFLDAIFGFLYRRTDYYVHLTPEGRMGFPPGIAKKMVLTAFKRYEEQAAKDEVRRESMRRQAELLQQQLKQSPTVPDCVREEEVSTSVVEEVIEVKQAIVQLNPASSSDAADKSSPVNENKHGESIEASSTANTLSTVSNVINSIKQSQDHLHTMETVDETNTESVITSNKTDESLGQIITDGTSSAALAPAAPAVIGDKEDDDEEQTKLQRLYQANSESYNGAIRDNYSWSQSITDVDIRVKVPMYIVKGREVTVEISRKHLKVSYKNASDGAFVVAVDDQLSWDINKEESIWSLVPGEHIHVNVEKCEERWWDSLLISEPKISVRKIDPSRPMTDLDDGAQAKIEEMMYNEQQKRLGLPQTHEKKVHDMLRQAWDTDGSPFKGQPFNPSQINISPSSMG